MTLFADSTFLVFSISSVNLAVIGYILSCLNTIMYLSIGAPKIINFPFGTNGKLFIFGFPKFRHITV